MVTPLTDKGAVDWSALEQLVDWLIEQGSNGLVPVGTTGESPTLTHDEHREVVEAVVRHAAGRVPVIAGAGSNNTQEAIELARHACEVGADGLLIVTPYYNKPTQAGLIAHFTAVHDATDRPIIIYNIPGRSVVDMTPETMGGWQSCRASPASRTPPAGWNASAASASPAGRISSSCRARMRPRTGSTRRAASAASRSPPMWRRRSARRCRRPAGPATMPRRCGCRTC